MVSKSKRRREAKKRATKVATLVNLTQMSKAAQSAAKAPARRRRARRNPASVNLAIQRQKFSGVDVVQQVVVTTDDGKDNLMIFRLSPTSFNGTRLESIASTWARWKPIKLKLELCPTASAMTVGAHIIGWVADPNQAFPQTMNLVRFLTTTGCSKQSLCFQPSTLVIPSDPAQRWYLCHGEPEDSLHGTICLARVGKPSANYNIVVKLHWTFEFEGPDYVGKGGGGATSVITQRHDYPGPLFTTSTNDWLDGKYLTFKEKEGGSVVPFPGALPNYVYKPMTSDIVVKAFTTASTESSVTFFSLILGSPFDSALALHANETDAISYQKSQSSSCLMKYFKASNWCSPDTLFFVGKPVTAIMEANPHILGPPHLLAQIEELQRQVNNLALAIQRPQTPGSIASSFVPISRDNSANDVPERLNQRNGQQSGNGQQLDQGNQ